MKRFFIFLLLFLISSFIFCGELKIRVADFKPMYYQETNGKWAGLSVELASALVKKAGFVPKFKVLPWSRALLNMQTGEIQVMANLSMTLDRNEYMYWIGPIRYEKMSLFVKKRNENLEIKDLDDLIKVTKNKGKKFGYQGDVFYSKEFNNRIKNDLAFQNAFDMILDHNFNILKTLSGRILGFFESKIALQYEIKHNKEYSDLVMHKYFLSMKKEEAAIYIGVSKKGVDINTLSKLYTAYRELLKDGSIDKILKKWEAD